MVVAPLTMNPVRGFSIDFHNSLSGHGDKGGISVLAHIVGTGVDRVEGYVPKTDYPMHGFKFTNTVDLV